MSARTLRPTGNHVLIEPLPPPEKSSGGIWLSPAWEGGATSTHGTVLAVGPGLITRKGARVAPDLVPGQRVTFNWIHGEEIEWEGKRLKMLDARQVIGVIES